MKKTKQPRQIFIAWALSSVYAMFWLLWSTHHFFAPEHQHEKKICLHAPNETHIHGEDYAIDHCPICHFLPAKAEFIQFEFSLALPSLVFFKQNFGDIKLFVISPLASSQPRAPPAPLFD
jgi:hypothetical protein